MSSWSVALRGLGLRARSVRVRLTLWYLGILLAVLVVFATVVYLVLSHGLRAEMDHSIEVVALGTLDINAFGKVDVDTQNLPPAYVASLYTPSGQLLASGGHAQLRWTTAAGTALQQRQRIWRSERIGEESFRVLIQPVFVGELAVGTLHVGRSEESVDRVVDQLGLLLATLVPLGLLLAGAGGFLLASRALDPIDRITRTATGIGANDLARRLPPETMVVPDEVGRLAAAFNHMLERLDNAFRRQRQFTADASHELRTPLALLLTQVDIALAQPRSPDDHRLVLLSLRQDLLRLRRLLDALLALARADAGGDEPVREPVDLGELAEQVVEGMRPLADDKGVRLAAEVEPRVVVSGDQAHLMQLVVNLVENALKHTPEGGRVTVSAGVDADGNTARMSVRDTGVGIAPEHVPHLFERFYRVDRARTAGGAGLGLAISRWIAEAHGGRIEVESRPGVGSTFTVRLRRRRRG